MFPPKPLTATRVISQETVRIDQISTDVQLVSFSPIRTERICSSVRPCEVWTQDKKKKTRGKWNNLRVLHHHLPFSDTSFCSTWPPSFAREEGTTMRWRISWTSTTLRWQTTPPLTERAKRSVGRKYRKKKHAGSYWILCFFKFICNYQTFFFFLLVYT